MPKAETIVDDCPRRGMLDEASKPDDGQPKHNATEIAKPVSNCQRRMTREGSPLNDVKVDFLAVTRVR
jgi:hypothetical protein